MLKQYLLIRQKPTAEVNKMEKIKVGIVGVGNMGSAHAACIIDGNIKGMELVALCDIDSQRIVGFAEKHPEIKCYSDYQDMINSKKIEAVIIATPHPFHADMAIAALKKGIHVMLEKPSDIFVSKVKTLNEIAEKSGKVFSIMFNQRTNLLFQKARGIVNNGLLGELKRTVWIVTNWYRTQHYYDSGDWRATWSGEGGGVLLNQAPHNLDIWQWICGMPESVTAYCDIGKYHSIEVEDDVTIFTRYKNGATGTFITSTGEYPGTNRLEITGTKGKIVLENGILKFWQLKQDEREVCFSSEEGFADIDYDYSEIVSDAPETAHKGILQNFANAILFGEDLITPGADGINELMISNAAYLSSWKGNTEIKIPFDCAEFNKGLLSQIDTTLKHSETSKINTSTGYKERWKVRW